MEILCRIFLQQVCILCSFTVGTKTRAFDVHEVLSVMVPVGAVRSSCLSQVIKSDLQDHGLLLQHDFKLQGC